MENVILYVHNIQIEVSKQELKKIFSRYGIVYKIDIVRPYNKKYKKKQDYLDAYIHYNLWAPREDTLQLDGLDIDKMYTGKSSDLDILPVISFLYDRNALYKILNTRSLRQRFIVKVFFQKNFLKGVKIENRKLLANYWKQYEIEKIQEELLIEKEAELLNKIYEIESKLQLVGLIQPPDFNFIDNHFLLRLEIMSYMEERIKNINIKIMELEKRIKC
tara:strand:- start:188 stop:841 length:654 start_codon:yes stop_codon:yes gene_type:complete